MVRYNHTSLRAELNSCFSVDWEGTSDTETLLFALEYWGLGNTLSKLTGMFSFALWDLNKQCLTLVRTV